MTPDLSITVRNDGEVFECLRPGDKARFVDATDITVRVKSITIYSRLDIYYDVTWIDSAKVIEARVRSFELEAV